MKVYECRCGKYRRVCNGNCDYWSGCIVCPKMTQEEIMNYWQQANKGYGYIVWPSEQQEIKMTRQEAIDKAKKYEGPMLSSEDWLVRCLEVLGLLKFEEDNDTIDKILQKRQQEVHGSTIRGDLYNAGYKIVRNKD